jgi:hypothetical protein
MSSRPEAGKLQATPVFPDYLTDFPTAEIQRYPLQS